MTESRIAYPLYWLQQRLWFRRCKGCSDPSPHSHDLTWLGRRRWTR